MSNNLHNNITKRHIVREFVKSQHRGLFSHNNPGINREDNTYSVSSVGNLYKILDACDGSFFDQDVLEKVKKRLVSVYTVTGQIPSNNPSGDGGLAIRHQGGYVEDTNEKTVRIYNPCNINKDEQPLAIPHYNEDAIDYLKESGYNHRRVAVFEYYDSRNEFYNGNNQGDSMRINISEQEEYPLVFTFNLELEPVFYMLEVQYNTVGDGCDNAGYEKYKPASAQRCGLVFPFFNMQGNVVSFPCDESTYIGTRMEDVVGMNYAKLVAGTSDVTNNWSNFAWD
ncbi:hypothetical protein H4219_004884 [Mycoemilia scoparia]|uniref:Uncharacterized protein n=1 Tax=Mycoemilia scoparia TaxID=417184 RepID=A0A9W7ZUX1_9FUNG|nr:hypothetical protein H4219_004884 [Mycoemilia scoparia]